MEVDGYESLLANTAWCPQPYLVYKPMKSGSGVAMRVQLRLQPEFQEVADGVVRPLVKGNGGLFLELAAQAGFGEGGFAAFGWSEAGPGGLLRVKLGLPDVLKLLTAIRGVRESGQGVPASLLGRGEAAGTVALFHKFGTGGTAISYKFEEQRSLVRVSKSKDWARGISLELHEELGLQAYLELALAGFLRLGVR